MIPALIVLGIIALSFGWHFFVYRQSGRPWWNPLWVAFTITGAAVLYVVAGTIGYALGRQNLFAAHSGWAGHVIWPQIAIGLAMGLASVFFWRKGLRRF